MNLGIFITLISSILALSRQHYFNRHHRKQISHTANALARAIPPCRVYSGKTPRACHLNEKRKHIMHYLRKLQAWNVSKTVHIPINSVKIIETEKCLSIEADLSTNKNIPKNCPFFCRKKLRWVTSKYGEIHDKQRFLNDFLTLAGVLVANSLSLFMHF